MPTNIGRVLNSPIGRVIVRKAADAAIQAAIDPSTPMEVSKVRQSKPRIEAEMAEAIAADPELQHITGAEAWYQKRSRWSAIVSGVLVVLGPVLVKYGVNLGPSEQELAITVCTMVGGVVAGYLAYRAGTAKKPLGA